MRSRLVVKATSGADAPERCAQAFTVASVGALSGVTVSLWLTGEASWFGVRGKAEQFVLAHSAPLAELLADVLASGTVTVCAQCAMRRGITEANLVNGVKIGGAASFLVETLHEDAQALVY